MSTYVIAATFDMLGTVTIAFIALRVHHRVLIDQKLDKSVFLGLRHEQVIGVLGLVLIPTASVMEMFEHYV